MSEKLLPCPFCGHETPEFERMGDSRQSCIVICGNCGARHESSDQGARNGSSWNSRAVFNEEYQRDLAQPSEGWVMVPVEPDSAMISAACNVDWSAKHPTTIVHNIWGEMLAAAPTEPMSAPTAEPVAWVRRHPDGTLTSEYLSDQSIEPVRKRSGGWVPLYATPPSAATPEPSDAERCPYCDDTGDVHDQTGEWRGTCKCPAGKVEACDIEAAAKVIAERMDYPWEHMYEKGRNNMRDIAREAIRAAIRATKGGKL